MMTRTLLPIFLLFFFCEISNGQPWGGKSASDLVDAGDEEFAKNQFSNALEFYTESYEQVNDIETAYRAAKAYMAMRDYRKAETWFERVRRKDKKNMFPDAHLQQAKMMKMSGMMDEATVELKDIITNTENKAIVEQAKFELAGIDLWRSMPEPVRLTIENASKTVNSPLGEIKGGVAPDGNKMYYSSYAMEEPVKWKGTDSTKYTARIFQSEKGPKGWSAPTELGEQINREGWNSVHPALSLDGKTLYFVRATLMGDLINSGSLFMSQSKGGGWGPAEEVPGVNGEWICRYPAAGELFGKEVLFFSSNKSGGYGGYDLYYATRTGETTFSEPVNLGGGINTAGDDISPFYRNGRLYFATDARPGVGGLDIFYSDWDGARWNEPKNLGKAYNTPTDDFGISMDKDGYTGVLISNRGEGKSAVSKHCCDDIYNITIAKVEPKLLTKVTDRKTKKPVTGVQVQLIEIVNNKPGNITPASTGTTNTANFDLIVDKSYKVIVSKADYEGDTITFNTVGMLESKTIEKNLILTPITKEPEYETYTTEQPIRLNNIYYDYDDDKILLDAEQDLTLLQGLMEQYPDMVIELSSHTDARGNDDYNAKLSQRRANSAKNWLVGRGVAEERIKPVGYGETVILNHCANGVECTDDEHRFNRRTEFKIISGPTSIKIEKKALKGTIQKEGGAPKPNPAGGKQSLNAFLNIFGDDQTSPTTNTRQEKSKKGTRSKPKAKSSNKTVASTPTTNTGVVTLTPNTEKERTLTVGGGFQVVFDAVKWDLGTPTKGTHVKRQFTFKNTGTVDVSLDMCSACDCMELDWTRKVIKPGESGWISADFNSGKKDKNEDVKDTINVIFKNTDPKTTYQVIGEIKYTGKVL